MFQHSGKIRVFAVLTVALLLATYVPPALADDLADDLAAGLEAYDGGDYETAAAHWKRAAESGDTDAMTSLAGLYMAGQGVTRNVGAAVRWYRMAAERGDVAAQFNLGDLLSQGTVLPLDRVAAYLWLGLAAHQGNAWAQQRQRAVGARMTEAEIAEARSRFRAWRTKKN